MSSTLPSKFDYFPSDHHAMMTRISWKVYLKQDYAKLKRSLFVAQWGRRSLPLSDRMRRFIKTNHYQRTHMWKQSNIINVSQMDIGAWQKLYGKPGESFQVQPNLNNLKLPRQFRVTESRAADYNEFKYRDVCHILNEHPELDWKDLENTKMRYGK